MILLLTAPAAGAIPPRDVVLGGPSGASASIAASASTGRYPINDGSGTTITVSVTAACQTSCNAADPQQIADFVGTLIHGSEVELLTVQLDAPYQIEFDCGFGALACYYSGQNKIILSGNETPTPDGASREFVLAHEYGHHIAQHRESPPPFPPAIDWGPPHWASYEHICEMRRTGSVFPGDEGVHYFEDPGEAFAEAFAHYRFPDADPSWRWLPSLRPDTGAFRAIREDTLEPWQARSSFLLGGRVPRRSGGPAVKSLRTPLDGTVSLRPVGQRRHYGLRLSNRAGRVLRTSRHGFGPRHQLNFTVCGQSRLRLEVDSTRRRGTPFRLQIQRP